MKQQRTFKSAHLIPTACLILMAQFFAACGMFTKTADPNAKAKNIPTEYGAKPPSSGQMAMLSYVDKYKTIAVKEMQRTGVPASIKLAQGLLESNAGRSELSTQSNNHFGIKCHSDWQGERYFKEDDDKDPLTGQLIKSCFRKYTNPEESFMAHSEFLRDPRKVNRYGSLFQLDKTDYVGWANGLQRAGYATANDYADKLVRIIEDYQLAQYDAYGVSGTTPSNRPNDNFPASGGGNNGGNNNNGSWNPNNNTANNNGGWNPNNNTTNNNGGWNPNENSNGGGSQRPFDTEGSRNNTRYIRAMNGETLYELAGKNGLSVAKLQAYNEELPDPNRALPMGTLVYTQQKRSRYTGDQKVHVVKECETMFDISQKYGIKLSKLLSKNELREGEQPAIGSVLLLRRGWFQNAEKPALRDTFGEWRRCQMGAPVQPTMGNPSNPTTSTRPSGRVDFEIPLGGNGNNSSQNGSDQPYFPPVGQPSNQGGGYPQNTNTQPYPDNSGNNNSGTTSGGVYYPPYPDNSGNNNSGSTTSTGNTSGTDPYPSYPSYPSTKPSRPTTTTPPPPRPTTTTTTTPPKPTSNPRPTTTPAPAPTKPATPAATGSTHVVAVGETLWAISRKYGTTVDALKKLNGLPDNTIKIGQQLRVK